MSSPGCPDRVLSGFAGDASAGLSAILCASQLLLSPVSGVVLVPVVPAWRRLVVCFEASALVVCFIRPWGLSFSYLFVIR